MNAYCISGIAADKRVFKHLQLPEGFTPRFIDWISPLPAETLPAYANRLTKQMDLTEPFVLIGVSLGGIMSSEISKQFRSAGNIRGTILIGSVPQTSQIPPYFTLLGKLKLQKIMPISWLLWAGWMKRYFTNESKEDKKDMREMIWSSDRNFVRWGMQAVLDWKNEELPSPFWHIHGTRDEVFPFGFVRPTHTIRKGDHLLMVSHPKRVNEILAEILSGIPL